MPATKRKTRSDKFPLTLHSTGQYCKKIRGRMYYFGSDKKQALERYLGQATFLHGGQNLIQKLSNGDMTLRELCDLHLQYQHSKVLANNLSPKHHNDQISSLHKLMSFLDHEIVSHVGFDNVEAVKKFLASELADHYEVSLQIMKIRLAEWPIKVIEN